MNFTWRVTKYNPMNRNKNDVYMINEWSSYSDIGKSFNGIKLNIDEYFEYEQAYVDSVLLLMKCNKIETLRIKDLEKYEDELECDIEEGMIISKEQIKNVIQNVLREKIWCKLINLEVFYVHFGYDYNMYIGSAIRCEDTIIKIEKSKMFIENLESPYN